MEMAALMSWEQPTLVQKLVGVLGHARGFVPHRVFDNVRHDTNLTLECLASTIRLLDFLPRVLYIKRHLCAAVDNAVQGRGLKSPNERGGAPASICSTLKRCSASSGTRSRGRNKLCCCGDCQMASRRSRRRLTLLWSSSLAPTLRQFGRA